MKKLLVLLPLLIGLSAWITPAKAGLFFCNDTGQSVYIAVGWNEEGRWLSQGWYNVKPRECGSTILGILKSTFYYYYAHTENLTWSGEGSNEGYFCTSNKAFFYVNNDTNCTGYTFKRLEVGDADQFTQTLIEAQKDPKQAALNCQGEITKGSDAFAKCWMRNIATSKQKDILDCYDKTASFASFTICANKDSLSADEYKVANCASDYNRTKVGGDFLKCLGQGQITAEQARVFDCAVNNKGNYGAMGACALAGQLTPDQQRIYSCVANNINSYVGAGLCAAGTQLTPEQNRIAGCVLKNRGSYAQMGVCAVGSNLTPEQQVFATCAISTGGSPMRSLDVSGRNLH